MRILYHHRIASKDGQYVHIEELTNAFINDGHELIIVAPSSISKAQFGGDSSLVSNMKNMIPGAIYEIMELLYSVIAFTKLSYKIIKFKPDFIYERYNLFFPAGIWAKKLFKLPLILEINAPLYDERSKYNGITLKNLAKWTEKYVWKNADHTLPVTSVLASYLKKDGVHDENITVIHNGINLKQYESNYNMADIHKHDNGEITLGFVGFVREWHGLDKVIDFIRKNNSLLLKLQIVGDGPGIKRIKYLLEKYDMREHVAITGIIERSDIPSYIFNFDIALQPSVVSYASPLKIFEYLAAGCAIIAPNQDNINEILTDQKDAILFDPSSEKEFENALKKLCIDTKLRKSISKNARDLIIRRGFTWNNNAKRVVEIAKQYI